MKKLKPRIEPGSTLVYDDLKGKLFQQLRIYQVSGSTSIELLFEDKTMFEISLEPQPHVRLSLYGERRNGDLKPISGSEAIPVPANE
jgi:hypothetical protein